MDAYYFYQKYNLKMQRMLNVNKFLTVVIRTTQTVVIRTKNGPPCISIGLFKQVKLKPSKPSFHEFARKQESQLNNSALVTVWRVSFEKGVTGVPTKKFSFGHSVACFY